MVSEGKHSGDPKPAEPNASPSYSRKPNTALATRLRPRRSTLAVFLLACWLDRRNAKEPSKFFHKVWRWIVISVAILNWRAVPFYWHVKTFLPVVKVTLRRWRLESNNEAFVAHQGVIGRSPFEMATVTKHCATWNACDFMFHLSNSSYAMALDEARCAWAVNKLAIIMGSDMECVRPFIASTHFAYFVEIPMLADYQIEVRAVSWDNKWVYLMATFTTDAPKGSTTRVVNCISITRTVNKIGRRTVPPAKLFAACGFGPDDSNWRRICKLRNDGHGRPGELSAAQEWLLNGEPPEGMECFEEQRKRNFEVIRSALDGCPVRGVDLLKTL